MFCTQPDSTLAVKLLLLDAIKCQVMSSNIIGWHPVFLLFERRGGADTLTYLHFTIYLTEGGTEILTYFLFLFNLRGDGNTSTCDMTSNIILCHLLSSYDILCHLMSSYVISCHLMSSCDIPFTDSNISYILQLPAMDIARTSNFLDTDLLTHHCYS